MIFEYILAQNFIQFIKYFFEGNLVTYSKWPNFDFVVFSCLFCSVKTDVWICSNKFLSFCDATDRFHLVLVSILNSGKRNGFSKWKVTGQSNVLVGCVNLRVLVIIDWWSDNNLEFTLFLHFSFFAFDLSFPWWHWYCLLTSQIYRIPSK